jgi:nucleoside-diphosphate-sugar epimerase
MITIVGGSGFIGTNLCSSLHSSKTPFHILDKVSSPLFDEYATLLNICEKEKISQNLRGDAIIHLAAEHRDNVKPTSLYNDVNVEGTKNICRAATLCGINRIIFTSSVAVYGAVDAATGEDGKISPFNEYGRTKLEAEQVLKEWVMEDAEKRSVTVVRPAVIFGPGNRGNVYNLLRQVANKKFIMVGSGSNIKSMAYVENVVSFLLYCLNFGPGFRIFNYVDEPAQSMNDLLSFIKNCLFRDPHVGIKVPLQLGLLGGYLADAVAAATNTNLPISSIRVRKFCSNTHFTSLAHSFTDFHAPKSLLDGLRHTIESEFLSDEPCHPIFFTE